MKTLQCEDVVTIYLLLTGFGDHLLHIKTVRVRVHTWVEHWIVKHHLGHVTIWVVFRYLYVKPGVEVAISWPVQCDNKYLKTPSWYAPCLMNRTPNQVRLELAEGMQ